MREIPFPVEFKSSGRPALVISVFTGPSHTAQEFIEEDMITKPVVTFLSLLSRWKGVDRGLVDVKALDARTLGFDIPAALVTEPWQVASIMAAIDSATWLEDLDDDPLITGVAVHSDAFADLSLDAAFADMDRFASECAKQLSGHLGDGFSVEGEAQTAWPTDAREYFFDIALQLAKPLEARYASHVRALLAEVEGALADTAFETDDSPESLFDEGLIPFPAKAEITDDAIRYAIETPPSDLSIPLVLLRDTLVTRYGVQISSWTVHIRERW